jgi:hypothetical protein
MKTIYFSLITVLFIVFSCTKEIPFKGDIGNGFIVVNGIIESDSIIKISLSKSKAAIGEQNTGPNEITTSATLILTDKTTGETFTSNTVNSFGEYEFGTKAKNGHSYSISITHPSYTTATSETSVPDAVQIKDWDTSSIKNEYNYSEKNLVLTIDDPSTENLYILKVFAVDSLQMEESLYLTPNENNQVFEDGGGISYLFDDSGFNGQSKKIVVKFNPAKYMDAMTYIYSKEKSYKVVLYNVSREVYNYILSTSKAMNSDGFFSEPVKIYTNITNGLGVFGGLNSSSVFIK